MQYPGGKNGAGVWQTLISQMPPHETYIEAFLGSGAVARRKRPALHSIGIDPHLDALREFQRGAGREFMRETKMQLFADNAIEFLPRFAANPALYLGHDVKPGRTLIYCDPPYLGSARRRNAKMYHYEMLGDQEHERLLSVLLGLPYLVMISGYRSELYDKMLSRWRRVDYWTSNRAGQRISESVWLNFPEPLELHDYRFLGNGYRERERIKRKQNRWRQMLLKMPALERHSLMAAIASIGAAGGTIAPAAAPISPKAKRPAKLRPTKPR